VTTVLKYGVLAALGLLAFTATGGSTKHFTPAWPAGAMLSPLASALIPVLWTYDGWADPATMGGEISNPQRNLPIALIAGALCVMLVYLVVNIGFLYALAPAEMAGSKLIASSVPARFLLASALMVLNALLTDPGNTAVTLLIIVAGVPAYWLRGRLWPRHSTGSWQ